VILVGHSYGGMVATGSPTARESASAPSSTSTPSRPGMATASFAYADRQVAMIEAANKSGDGWKMPPSPMPPARRGRQAWAMPAACRNRSRRSSRGLRLQHGELTLPRHYIYCKRCPPDDRFRQFYDRARNEGWVHMKSTPSHNPHITAPKRCRLIRGMPGSRSQRERHRLRSRLGL